MVPSGTRASTHPQRGRSGWSGLATTSSRTWPRTGSSPRQRRRKPSPPRSNPASLRAGRREPRDPHRRPRAAAQRPPVQPRRDLCRAQAGDLRLSRQRHRVHRWGRAPDPITVNKQWNDEATRILRTWFQDWSRAHRRHRHAGQPDRRPAGDGQRRRVRHRHRSGQRPRHRHQGRRQAGSAFKPITLVAALENGASRVGTSPSGRTGTPRALRRSTAATRAATGATSGR